LTSLQKREVSLTLNQDLKEAVSLVHRHNYERVLERTHDLAGLRAIERQVRMDPSLSQGDRVLLMSAVTRAFRI